VTVSTPDDHWRRVQDHIGDGVSALAWSSLQDEIRCGSRVRGRVLAHQPFGYFVALPKGNLGLVEIVSIKEPGEPVSMFDYPPLGADVDAVVLDFTEHNRQVRLSARPSVVGDGAS
jgi:ribosomal protein S1